MSTVRRRKALCSVFAAAVLIFAQPCSKTLSLGFVHCFRLPANTTLGSLLRGLRGGLYFFVKSLVWTELQFLLMRGIYFEWTHDTEQAILAFNNVTLPNLLYFLTKTVKLIRFNVAYLLESRLLTIP